LAARTQCYWAVVRADATATGDGGRVIVWADDSTGFHGLIRARGGATGGNGGFVETSGKVNLAVTGSVDTRAPAGRTGTWLLDPTNITVISGPGAFISLAEVDAFGDPNSGPNTLSVSLIDAAASNVSLQAANDITFATSVNMTNAGVGLTARAGNDIIWGGNTISTNNGSVSFTANDPGGTVTGSGRIFGSGAISTGTGNVTMSVPAGVGEIHAGPISANAVNLTSTGPVLVDGNIAATGAVVLTGTGNAGSSIRGVKIDNVAVTSPPVTSTR